MGEKKKAGRKAKGAADNAGVQLSRRVTLDDGTVDILRRAGAGNLSAGIRYAAEILRTLNRTK